jgi:RNA polymerase sigma factor (sigma-70 family)
VAAELDLTLEEYHAFFGNGREAPMLAGGKPGGDEGETENGLDFFEDPRQEGPLEDAHRRELLERIATVLDPEARAILFMRYFENRTLREIGETLAISQSRVSKIIGRLMDRLKDRFEDKVN